MKHPQHNQRKSYKHWAGASSTAKGSYNRKFSRATFKAMKKG